MKAPTSTPTTRMRMRRLDDILVEKFMTEYGYSHGPVIARAIVEDIVGLLTHYYVELAPPQTILWLAARREGMTQRAVRRIGDLVLVQLAVVTEAEVALLTDPQLTAQQQAIRHFQRQRLVRWCQDAYAQGGVLTQLDLSLMTGHSETAIRRHLAAYEADSGQVVPIRGTVHDIGPSVTHKAEAVRRWLRGQTPLEIARTMQHSQGAIDTYLQAYQRVRLLAPHFPVETLAEVARMSRLLVAEYLKLLRQYEPTYPIYPASSPGEVRPAEPAAGH
jgi:hypothetical protein